MEIIVRRTILRYKTIVRLKECKQELKTAVTYTQAEKMLKRFRFKLAEYGDYEKEADGRQVCLAFYNHNGLRENPYGILLTYYMEKMPGNVEIAGNIKDTELCLV